LRAVRRPTIPPRAANASRLTIPVSAVAALIALIALSGCADKQIPTDSYCLVYTRVLPDRDEITALKRPTKEAILANERAYVRDCGQRMGPR
jgi:hypothetical protein